MTTTVIVPSVVPTAPVMKTGTNPRRELARYTASRHGERIIYAQRVDGRVRLTDVGEDRCYLIEAGLDSMAALQALLDDYLAQAHARSACPMARSLLADYLDALFG